MYLLHRGLLVLNGQLGQGGAELRSGEALDLGRRHGGDVGEQVGGLGRHLKEKGRDISAK